MRHDGFSLSQTRRPVRENDIPDSLEKWRVRAESDWSWIVPVEEIAANSYDLTELLVELQELLGGDSGAI